MRARVEEARGRQRRRGPRSNARLTASELDEVAPIDTEGHRLLERAVERLGLSARAVSRVRRMARTIADLEGTDRIRTSHLAEALQYRLLDRPIDP